MAKKGNNQSTNGLENTLRMAEQSIEKLNKAISEAKNTSTHLTNLINNLKQKPKKTRVKVPEITVGRNKNKPNNNSNSSLTHYIKIAVEQSAVAMECKKKNNIEEAKKAAHKAKEASMDAETEVRLHRIKDKKIIELIEDAVKKSDIAIKKTYGNERPHFTGDSVAEFPGEDAYGNHLF
jgi:uncharacterized coiled-coil protein SlyX